MTNETIIPVTAQWAKHALINKHTYRQMYHESVENPDAFWAAQAEQFSWRGKWNTIKQTNFYIPLPIGGRLGGGHLERQSQQSPHPNPPPAGEGVFIKWFDGAILNITENCLDRHLPARAAQTAYIWEGDDPKESKKITYGELFEQVCRLANVLKTYGVKKGDRVTIYLPMIPEAAVAMLACARIGAVHSVVFAGFSADALKGRIEDCGSTLVITADESLRGGKKVPLKANVDEAIKNLDVAHVIVVKRTGGDVAWNACDHWYHEEMAKAAADCPGEIMNAEDPLFILYTSGSTGKPKGVLHTIAGYMVWAGVTHKYTFDYHAPKPSPLEGEGWEGGVSASSSAVTTPPPNPPSLKGRGKESGMSRTLELLFDELGYHNPEKQLAVTALLRRAGILDMEAAILQNSLPTRGRVGAGALLAQTQRVSSPPTLPPNGGGISNNLVLLDPARIQSNPEVYQFRFGGDANGVTHKGRYHADAWNPVLHGDPLLVHQRLDGQLFVADGHHRLDLAKRLNAQGRGPDKLAAVLLREADGYTALDAKIIGAYKNIAHGYTDPVETAYVLKDATGGNINQDKLPKLYMEKGNLPIAAKLAKLTRKALSLVGVGKVPVEMGLEVAMHVHDPVQQEAVLHIISKKLNGGYVEKLQQQREKSASMGLGV